MKLHYTLIQNPSLFPSLSLNLQFHTESLIIHGPTSSFCSWNGRRSYKAQFGGEGRKLGWFPPISVTFRTVCLVIINSEFGPFYPFFFPAQRTPLFPKVLLSSQIFFASETCYTLRLSSYCYSNQGFLLAKTSCEFQVCSF